MPTPSPTPTKAVIGNYKGSAQFNYTLKVDDSPTLMGESEISFPINLTFHEDDPMKPIV